MPGPSSSCILRPKPDPVCGYRTMRSGTDWEDVGERMRVARLAASLTQEELSARAGLDRTMLVKTESGARRIDAMELIRLSSALGAAGFLAASRKLSEPAAGACSTRSEPRD